MFVITPQQFFQYYHPMQLQGYHAARRHTVLDSASGSVIPNRHVSDNSFCDSLLPSRWASFKTSPISNHSHTHFCHNALDSTS